MTRLYFYLLFISCILYSCSPLNGTWVSREDNKYKVMIKHHMFYEIYGTDTSDAVKYYRSQTSCDTSYLDIKYKADFIRLMDNDKSCYEITGVSDSVLAYRYTATGRLHVFTKEK